MSSATGDFKAQLGRPDNPGLLPLAERLKSILPGQNPYVTGPPLPANSPLFFGHVQTLYEILSVLRRPDKPGCVSLIGERRIGKSSLLNQLYQALAREPNLVSIHAIAQDWDQNSQKHFYTHLQRAISAAAGQAVPSEATDYPSFCDFVHPLARDYRFMLIIDEFEEMAGNPNFDGDFFSNLRALADRPEYRFGYLVSSHRPLKELCRTYGIASSSFWNIFGFRHVLGLLSESGAQGLVVEPLRRSLPSKRPPDWVYFWKNAIEPLTGRHPAFIQMGAAAYWNALGGGYRSDRLLHITMGMRDYLKDLWDMRSQEEQDILIRAAAGNKVPRGPVPDDLIQRGLLTPDGKPFSRLFGEVITDCLPKGKSLQEALEDLEKGAGLAAKLFKPILDLAEMAGKLRRAFKNPKKGEEESNS
jgi:hypothetical protein